MRQLEYRAGSMRASDTDAPTPDVATGATRRAGRSSGGRSKPHWGRVVTLFALVALGYFLWDTPAAKPFKLLAVMGHETGHAIASKLVGGTVQRVNLQLDESGACVSAIPQSFLSRVLVYSAGYVGSAILALLLLVASTRLRLVRMTLFGVGLWLLAMAILYAGNATMLGFCIAMAASVGAAAFLLPTVLVEGITTFISVFIGMYAAFDLRDLWDAAARSQSDAQLLANVSGVPAIAWSVLWTALSLCILALAVKLTLGGRDR